MRIKRYTLLEYLNTNFDEETIVNKSRIFDFNKKPISDGIVLYLCDRNIRVEDNFALNFAIEQSKTLNRSLKIIYKNVVYESSIKNDFINKQIKEVKFNFLSKGLDFSIIEEDDISKYINLLNPGLLVIDFNPIRDNNFLRDLKSKIYEVDSTNIIPARYISDKQEYSAASFRVKVYNEINGFLTEFPCSSKCKLKCDKCGCVDVRNQYAKNRLGFFINNNLNKYNDYRNYPDKNCISGLSKYLNLGFISSQRVVLAVIKSNVSKENKEAFLEEIIVRKELSDNYCLYNRHYNSFAGIPEWGKRTLIEHKGDFRQYVYTKSQFEKALTHDSIWNAAQNQLVRDGVIHGQLRMYWAKKILEWTKTPNDAIDIAVYLNDKYAFDAPSPNGYVGILWSIGGLHDRPFREFDITGQIRKMTSKGIETKYGIDLYLKKYNWI